MDARDVRDGGSDCGGSWRHRRRALVCLALGAFFGCSTNEAELNTTEMLTLAMTGVFEAPPTAMGSAEPKSVVFTLTGVSATTSDGEEVDLYEGEDSKEIKIISRSQIIHEVALKDDTLDLVGQTLSELKVTFDPTITGATGTSDELTAELTTPDPVYQEPVEIETAKSYRLDIAVQWKNTVSVDETSGTETLSSPTMTLDLSRD